MIFVNNASMIYGGYRVCHSVKRIRRLDTGKYRIRPHSLATTRPLYVDFQISRNSRNEWATRTYRDTHEGPQTFVVKCCRRHCHKITPLPQKKVFIYNVNRRPIYIIHIYEYMYINQVSRCLWSHSSD